MQLVCYKLCPMTYVLTYIHAFSYIGPTYIYFISGRNVAQHGRRYVFEKAEWALFLREIVRQGLP